MGIVIVYIKFLLIFIEENERGDFGVSCSFLFLTNYIGKNLHYLCLGVSEGLDLRNTHPLSDGDSQSPLRCFSELSVIVEGMTTECNVLWKPPGAAQMLVLTAGLRLLFIHQLLCLNRQRLDRREDFPCSWWLCTRVRVKVPASLTAPYLHIPENGFDLVILYLAISESEAVKCRWWEEYWFGSPSDLES